MDTHVAHTLNAKGGAGRIDSESETFVTHALRAEGFDASEDATGRGTPIVPIAFNARQDPVVFNRHTGPLDTDGSTQCVAYDMRGREGGAQFEGPHETANMRAASGGAQLTTGGSKPGQGQPCIADQWAVRRLTPIECERLQGFPDGYTQVPYRGKAAADGPRYKALGNSMAVNVMRWIGRRIQKMQPVLDHERKPG